MSVESFIENVKFDAHGLVAAIAQDAGTNQVLMMAFMNREALLESLETGKMVYWSRSRQKRWMKGETSGNIQNIKEARIDCDGDALLFKVEQVGEAACHTGYVSCFHRKWDGAKLEISEKKCFDPDEKYGKKR